MHKSICILRCYELRQTSPGANTVYIHGTDAPDDDQTCSEYVKNDIYVNDPVAMTGETVPRKKYTKRRSGRRIYEYCGTFEDPRKYAQWIEPQKHTDLDLKRRSRDALIARNRNYHENISIGSTYRWCVNNNDRYQRGRIISVRQTRTAGIDPPEE